MGGQTPFLAVRGQGCSGRNVSSLRWRADARLFSRDAGAMRLADLRFLFRRGGWASGSWLAGGVPAPDDRSLGPNRIMALWLVIHRRISVAPACPCPYGLAARLSVPCATQHWQRAASSYA